MAEHMLLQLATSAEVDAAMIGGGSDDPNRPDQPTAEMIARMLAEAGERGTVDEIEETGRTAWVGICEMKQLELQTEIKTLRIFLSIVPEAECLSTN